MPEKVLFLQEFRLVGYFRRVGHRATLFLQRLREPAKLKDAAHYTQSDYQM
jgi:hypothetical protein